MEVTEKVLRQRYESMEDEELVDLYVKSELKVTEKRKIQVGLFFPITLATFNVTSELTDIAKSVLREVLAARGINVVLSKQ